MNDFQAWTRRLLALPIGVGTAATLIYLAVMGDELSKEALVALVALGSGVVGYYFGQKE